MSSSLEAELKKLALINATQYEGKANANAVFGRAMGTIPAAKKDARKTRELSEKIAKEINNVSIEEQQKEMARLKIEVPKQVKEERRTELPPLKGAIPKSMVTRFAPEPNGLMHFGHLKAAVMSNFYAKMYKGKSILRFDDTNPRKEKKEFYDAIKKDLDALGFKWDVVTKTTDHFEDIYSAAEKMISKGLFYVCTCPQETIKNNREKSIECACRSKSPDDVLALWKKMQKDMKEGTVCVRLKIDMKSRNPVLRDPTMLRIVDFEHPVTKNKYRVFPLYNFSTVICDHKLGVTYVFRDKGFENDAVIQNMLYEHLGWKAPEASQFGRLKTMAGIPLSKRKQKELVDEGKLSGLEDLQIPTPRNFLKRGFLPKALIQVMIAIGPSKSDIDVSEEMLASFNRKLVDAEANRYFFVPEPVLMNISGAPETVAHPLLHPNHSERGKRSLKSTGKVFVSKNDIEYLKKSKEVRLKDLYNIEITGIGKEISAKYTGGDVKSAQKIQWVPFEGNTKVTLVMPKGPHIEGLAEKGLKEGVIQFERIGFARVVKEKGKFKAYFAHP
ncbi:MAG: glutamate--tRNA ligase [Candidatus Aenigmarchaeota archaeon]|nr:glutamate--tRNA ligase [Candidatus Aenigmarchaeota archaeon]